MPDHLKIGFVGFGEAAYHIARSLRESGASAITAFDINTYTPRLGDTIRSRAQQAGARLVNTNEELAQSSHILLSTVTANQAGAAAAQNAPYLSSQHFYADLNSVSPGLKRSIASRITATGARFVEIAVMAPVPPYGHCVPMLAGGESADFFADRLRPLGFSIKVVSLEVGTAAATKMFRSIIVKGLEALITECVLGASRYHAEDRVFASLAESFPGMDWQKLADYMIGRVIVHGERRAREMEEVAETLRSSEVEPIMAEAIVRRMDWAASLDLKSHFLREGPKTYREVLNILGNTTGAS